MAAVRLLHTRRKPYTSLVLCFGRRLLFPHERVKCKSTYLQVLQKGCQQQAWNMHPLKLYKLDLLKVIFDLLPNLLWKYAGLCFAHLVSISLPNLMLYYWFRLSKTPGIGQWKPPCYDSRCQNTQHSKRKVKVGKKAPSWSHWEM